MSLDRRQFLALSTGLALINPLRVWAAPAKQQKLLVLIYLRGGNDAYNTFVPLQNDLYRKLRPTLAISREKTLHISESLGFNAALKPLLPQWENGELALIQGIGQEDVTDQHYRDLEMQFTGAGLHQYLNSGWVTRALLENPVINLGASGLDALAFGDLDIRVTDPMGPFRGNAVRAVQIQHPADWLTTRRLQDGMFMANTPATPIATRWQAPLRRPLKTAFPETAFGFAMRAIVELADAGRAPLVVHVTLNADDADQHHAFDTHENQQAYHSATLARLAEGMAALRDGMREIGQWDHTLVLTYDEFGRSPNENPGRGTHHGWASVQMAAGGKVKGGLIGNALPVVDAFSIGGAKPHIDYRSLYSTVIEQWWGGSAAGVFAGRFPLLDLIKA